MNLINQTGYISVDTSAKENAILYLCKLVEDFIVDKRYMIIALESLLYILQGAATSIKYLCSLQDCLFRENVPVTRNKTNYLSPKYQDNQFAEQKSFLVGKNFAPAFPKVFVFGIFDGCLKK